MVFLGLMSSSENMGSRTETGFGLSGVSDMISLSEMFLAIKELEEDPGGEDSDSFSSFES